MGRCLIAFGIILTLFMNSGCASTETKQSNTTIPNNSQHMETTTQTPEPTPEPTPTPEPNFNITLSFAGDCLIASYKDQTKTGNFNDYVNNNEPTYFLQHVAPIFAEDDFTVVNLENVLSDDTTLSPTNKGYTPAYWYKSKTSNTEILTSSSVEGVSLSNNHTNDYGSKGYSDTIQAVENAGLNYGTSDKTMYFEKNGFRIAIICNGLWSSGQADTIINRIHEAEKDSDYQIIFYHGGTERVHKPEQWRVDASRKLVDAGADLVIGGHPHVIQPMETYNGVDILYSLGNFCFGDEKHAENRTLIYQQTLIISKDGLKLENVETNIIPCYVYTAESNNYCPAPITDEVEKQRVLDFLNWIVDSPI